MRRGEPPLQNSYSIILNPGKLGATVASDMNTLHQLILREVEILFRPFAHRKIQLPTRIVMAQEQAPYGLEPQGMMQYYRYRAANEVGLILTAPVAIDDVSAAADMQTPLFYGGTALRTWKQICRVVHATHCKIAPLLRHAGMCRAEGESVPHPEAAPIGPSGINPYTLKQSGETISSSRMSQVVEAYAKAALAAKELNFDAVEIDGAAGSLIDQFFRAETNHRHDVYSAQAIARTRFAADIIHAIRKKVGKNFPIIFRFSQRGIGQCRTRLANTPEELAEFLQPLRNAGVDIFHCTGSPFSLPEFEGSGLNLAGWTRIITGAPVISTGEEATQSHKNLQKLYKMMQREEVDLISLMGELNTDPTWASQLHRGDAPKR